MCLRDFYEGNHFYDCYQKLFQNSGYSLRKEFVPLKEQFFLKKEAPNLLQNILSLWTACPQMFQFILTIQALLQA